MMHKKVRENIYGLIKMFIKEISVIIKKKDLEQ
jgi:hypothetical protein